METEKSINDFILTDKEITQAITIMERKRIKERLKRIGAGLETSYYTRELNTIQTNSDFAPTVKVFGADGQSTKHLSLNKESASDLVNWLKVNFNV